MADPTKRPVAPPPINAGASTPSIGEKAKSFASAVIATAKRLALVLAPKAKRLVLAVATRTKAAAQLTAMQIVRVKIAKYSLPKVYTSFGKAVYEDARYREEFAHVYETIDSLLTRIEVLKEAKQLEANHKLVEKVKAVGTKVRNALTAQALSVKANGLMRQLGKMVFEKHREESGTEPLIAPILRYHSRTVELEAGIKSLEAAHTDVLFTPRRTAIGGGILLAFLAVGIMGSFVPSSTARTASSSRTISPKTEDKNDIGTRTTSHGVTVVEPRVSFEGRKLAAQVGTSVEVAWWVQKHYNPSLQNVAVYATSDHIIITFDVEFEQWEKTGGNWMFPLLVRLFDRNGQYLTHFQTSEAFATRAAVVEMYSPIWERGEELRQRGISLPDNNSHKPILLRAKGNRLEYIVNTRDLQSAEAVEIGFLDNVM